MGESGCVLCLSKPELQAGLYVVKHEEVQRYDLCLCVCIMVEE